jgi:hypothetical protein
VRGNVIRGNFDNVRGYEKAGSKKGPAHLKIVLHYWDKQAFAPVVI